MAIRRIGMLGACATLVLFPSACDEGQAVEGQQEALLQKVVLSPECRCDCGWWEIGPDTVFVEEEVVLDGVTDAQVCAAADGSACEVGNNTGTLDDCRIVWTSQGGGDGDGGGD